MSYPFNLIHLLLFMNRWHIRVPFTDKWKSAKDHFLKISFSSFLTPFIYNLCLPEEEAAAAANHRESNCFFRIFFFEEENFLLHAWMKNCMKKQGRESFDPFLRLVICCTVKKDKINWHFFHLPILFTFIMTCNSIPLLLQNDGSRLLIKYKKFSTLEGCHEILVILRTKYIHIFTCHEIKCLY